MEEQVASTSGVVMQKSKKILEHVLCQLRNIGQKILTTVKRIWREFPPLRPLIIYASILSVFALLECIIAFMLSHSLVVLFCAFYTVHRAFHYLILILGYVLEKHQVNTAQSTLFVSYSYGYRRLEVILRFSNGVFATFIAFAFCTEGIQRLVEPHHFHMDYMTIFAIIGIVINFGGVYLFSPTGGVTNKKGLISSTPYPSPYSYKNFSLSSMSTNNTWQEYAMSALFSFQNHLRKQRQLLYEWLIEAHVHVAVFVTTITYTTLGDSIEVLIVMLEAFITIYFVFPVITDAASILLQTTPENVLVQLGRCVSEASKLEDVLECVGEHFWTVCPPSGSSKVHVIGSIKVRVVESANEQTVLRNVQRVFAEKKSFTIELTIQVEKRSLIEGTNSSSHVVDVAQPIPSITSVIHQQDNTIINIGSSFVPEPPSDTYRDKPTVPTTTISIASNDDLDYSDGLGSYVDANSFNDDDDMFGKLQKSNSGTNLHMRQRDHGLGTKQIFSLAPSGVTRSLSSNTLESKTISPHEDDIPGHESNRSSSPSLNVTISPQQESTNKEE
jgi:Co/Zn/Cd efflux system component